MTEVADGEKMVEAVLGVGKSTVDFGTFGLRYKRFGVGFGAGWRRGGYE